MPEGDSVWRTAALLRRLDGQVLTTTDFRIPSLATRDLAGRRIETTLSRGKHLLTRIEGGVTLHSHLVMEGEWVVQRAGERWRRPAHQARAVLTTQTHQAVGFEIRLELLPTDEEDRAVGHLGPDLLDPAWGDEHVAEAVRRLREHPDQPLGEALLEQRHLAGIGNVYACELCFLAGQDPRTPVHDVRDLERIVRRAHQVLAANLQGPRVTTGDRRPGRRLWVYGRKGPCLRCGTQVAKADLGPLGRERPTYWCPSCQPPLG